MREAAGDDRVPGDDVAGGHGLVEEAASGWEVVATGAPERGEERVPGDDVTVRHGVEHPARRGDIARAGEGADALVVAEEAAGGEGGGATEREHLEAALDTAAWEGSAMQAEFQSNIEFNDKIGPRLIQFTHCKCPCSNKMKKST